MRALSIYFLLLFMTSCNCEDQYLCPPLSEDGIAWIEKMHGYGDTVEYHNNLGEIFKFNFVSKYISPSEVKNTCYQSGFSCYCEHQCDANGDLNYEPDSEYYYQNYYSVGTYESSYKGTINRKTVFFRVFDFRTQLSSDYPLLGERDSFYNSIIIDNVSFNNVYVFVIDTTNEYQLNQKVWKTYISKDEGIIAFWERPSNTLFVRQ